MLTLMIRIVPVALGCLIISLNGCAAGKRNLAPNSALEKYHLVSSAMNAMGDIDEIIRAYYDSENDEERKSIRNELVSAFLMAIDSEFELFVDQVSRNRAVAFTIFDASVIGAGTAGALATHAATAQLLAGLSAALTGGRAAVDKNFYFEQAMPVLQAKMEVLRRESAIEVRAGFEKTTVSYPLGLAIADLQRYYLSGTLGSAIASLMADAAREPVRQPR